MTHLQEFRLTIAYPQKIKVQPFIVKQINDFIDIAKYRLLRYPLQEVADSVSEKIFDLRFSILEYLANAGNGKTLYDDLQQRLNQEIAQKMQMQQYSILAKAIAEAMHIYSEILANAAVVEPLLNFRMGEGLNFEKPNYNSLKVLEYHPAPQIRYFKKWIDASLHLEFAFIVADEVLRGEINMTQTQIKQLAIFLTETAELFGAYSIFTEFWKPSNNTFNKIEIIAAALQLEAKQAKQITLNHLQQLTMQYG